MKSPPLWDIPISTLTPHANDESRPSDAACDDRFLRGFNRRQFLRWAAAATALNEVNQAFLPRLSAAVQEAVKDYPLVWMQTSACSGCSVSVINTVHPSIKNVILDQILPGHQLYLNYHSRINRSSDLLTKYWRWEIINSAKCFPGQLTTARIEAGPQESGPPPKGANHMLPPGMAFGRIRVACGAFPQTLLHPYKTRRSGSLISFWFRARGSLRAPLLNHHASLMYERNI